MRCECGRRTNKSRNSNENRGSRPGRLYFTEDIRRVRVTLSGVSERRSCLVLAVGRARLHRAPAGRSSTSCGRGPGRCRAALTMDSATSHVRLSASVGCTASADAPSPEQEGPIWGAGTEAVVGASTVMYPQPRVHGWISRASRSDERWAMDVTHIPCGHDGWANLAAVMDCYDREIVGCEFALPSRAKEDQRAVEAACLQRFGRLQPANAPRLRSDNGLIFHSRRFHQACRDYRLQQEFITPYTPEQNGLIE